MSIGSEIGGQTGPYEDAAGHAAFSSDTVPYLLSMADAFIILVSSLASSVGYQLAAGYPVPDLVPVCAMGLLTAFIYILRLSGSDYYDFPECAKPRVEIGEITICWVTTGLLLAFFAFLLKTELEYSRGAFIAFYLITPIGLLGIRKLAKTYLAVAASRGTIGRRDVVLLADESELASFERQDFWALFGTVEVKSFVLSRQGDDATRALEDEQTFDSVASFARQKNCREIVLALPWGDVRRMEVVRDRLKCLPVAVRLIPDARVRSLTNFTSSIRQRVLAIEIQRAPLSRIERLVKRSIDVVGAGAALVLFLPVMVITAVAIKLDSRGPVIFKQTRRGFNGQRFVMFKFRTMRVQEDGGEIAQATRNDPRVTAIGRLLRSTSIDEIPQLLNVLKGEMSLIGPRPHALAHDSHFETLLRDYAFRHHVKPGITGWAQCNGARGATPSVEHISERVKLDLWYINNWSLALDVQIFIKTFFEVLRKRNAY